MDASGIKKLFTHGIKRFIARTVSRETRLFLSLSFFDGINVNFPGHDGSSEEPITVEQVKHYYGFYLFMLLQTPNRFYKDPQLETFYRILETHWTDWENCTIDGYCPEFLDFEDNQEVALPDSDAEPDPGAEENEEPEPLPLPAREEQPKPSSSGAKASSSTHDDAAVRDAAQARIIALKFFVSIM